MLQSKKRKIVYTLPIFITFSLLFSSGCARLSIKKYNKSSPTQKDTVALADSALPTDDSASLQSRTKNIKPDNLFIALVYRHRAQAYFLKEEYEKSWGDVQSAQRLGYRFDSRFLEALKQALKE